MKRYGSKLQASAENEEEIIVTEEMIEAGVSELIGVIDFEIDEKCSEIAVRVFQKMVQAYPSELIENKNLPQM